MDKAKIDDIFLELIEGPVGPAADYCLAAATKAYNPVFQQALLKAAEHCAAATEYIKIARKENARG